MESEKRREFEHNIKIAREGGAKMKPLKKLAKYGFKQKKKEMAKKMKNKKREEREPEADRHEEDYKATFRGRKESQMGGWPLY